VGTNKIKNRLLLKMEMEGLNSRCLLSPPTKHKTTNSERTQRQWRQWLHWLHTSKSKSHRERSRSNISWRESRTAKWKS